MNRDELERAVRDTLRENVAGIDPAAVESRPLAGRSTARGRRRVGVLSALATVVVVALIAVTVSVLASGSGSDGHSSALPGGGAALTGRWRLIGASENSTTLAVTTRPVITLDFTTSGAVKVDDGVNTVMLSVSGRDARGFTARFRSTTYVLDGSTDPARRAVLALLDSMAPSTSTVVTRDSYRLVGDRLVITTPKGELTFTGLSGSGGGGSSVTMSTTPAGFDTVPATHPS